MKRHVKSYKVGDSFYEVKEHGRLLPPTPENTVWERTGAALTSDPLQIEYRLEVAGDCTDCDILRDNGFTVKCNPCIAKDLEREGNIVEKCKSCSRPLPGLAAIQHGGLCVGCFH